MTLQFERIGKDPDERLGTLPENYLPIAIPYLAKKANAALYLLRPTAPDQGKDGMKSVPAKLVEDPLKMAEKTKDGRPSFLMKESPLSGFTLRSEPNDLRSKDIVAILDTGFAFWNPQFRDDAGENVFFEIAYLDFAKKAKTLLPEGFKCFYRLADKPGGEARVIEALGQSFGGSIFRGCLRAGQMSHGTVIADLVSRIDADDPSGVRTKLQVLGVELPRRALLDRSGALLQAVILQAVQHAIASFRGRSFNSLTVVLPFAFLGGPHDVGHPGIRFLQEVIDTEKKLPEIQQIPGLRIVVPMGNHRQDRQHARFPVMEKGECRDIAWRVPYDDHSSNSMDILCNTEQPPELHLTAPDGSHAHVTLEAPGFAKLLYRNEVVGGVLTRAHGSDKIRVRLSLAGTARRAKDKVTCAPYGDWRVGIEARRGRVEATAFWILRDDSNRHLPGEPPRRASQFHDPAYRERDANLHYLMVDEKDRNGTFVADIRRAGTASVLSAVARCPPALVSVGAQHRRSRGAVEAFSSWYSGMALDGTEGDRQHVVDVGREVLGLPALGSGTARLYRVSGTSVAAALEARK